MPGEPGQRRGSAGAAPGEPGERRGSRGSAGAAPGERRDEPRERRDEPGRVPCLGRLSHDVTARNDGSCRELRSERRGQPSWHRPPVATNLNRKNHVLPLNTAHHL
ncbi:b63 [miniopterid betaherpesvirus 1]|uniref:B63 n=1 Tax=miniopterid betaherpesvirus 1 TaxID=3070189 RepID=I3VQ52_9BETA|nr:b63 [miniopterid betaherpesvirus 1]AFK83896.1 b63 [miniopterid betaherpesvirus 1]